jgi:hypothetical protein
MRVSRFKFGVTFNGCRGEFEIGDSMAGTTDYIGDDVNELVREVIEDSIVDDYPLLWIPHDDGGEVVGIFCDNDSVAEVLGTDETPYPTAILYREFRAPR